MTTAEARQLVQKTFQNPFDKGQFVYFIKNLVNEIDESKAFHARGYVHEKYRDRVKTYERVGTYTDPEDNKIDVLIVYLQKESSIDRARTTLRNFVGDYLKERGEKEAGLIAFVSPNQKDWRFSLVKMEYKITETPSGRIKAKEEFTPAKRYSFLVGVEETSHTAQSRLVPILEDDKQNPALKQIEEAFNIEKVTKEFFEKYRDLYLRVKETLDEVLKKDKAIKADFDAKNIDTVDFGKKLLGQIVFLYFLQKKGWFGVKRGEAWGSGSKNFLRELFDKKHGDYKNFFNDTLEPLFYEALRNDRSHDDHYFSMFKCKIPFLNGGLFDPINNYDWKETDIILPNDLFSNSYKTKEGDIGTGILDIFDRYNFTVKEDEPLEKEVAVDPEMLGKVFENLLEVKDRRSKGTYYTPREIVHYMCQESLANYLATELEGKANKEDIETLIKYGETVVEHDSRVASEGRETERYSFKLPQSVRKHAKLIDEKLAAIRVCDPAVGSGAFPVGMMNEIIRTRNALTPYIGKDGERTPYHFKREAIQNCLYGVDIDPGAVEIAKLRLWLSLVVDEEERETIQPLPNLDYKIVQGNSLLSVEKNLFNVALFSKLEELKPLYFNETSASKKQGYRKQIDELISQITNGHKDFDFEVYFSEIFHEKEGFDVVIANPPYLRIQEIQKNSPKLASQLKTDFISATGSFDIYACFVEQAIKLISKEGNIAFILPHKFFQAAFGKSLRKLISSKSMLRKIIDFGGSQVFETATTYTCLLFLSHHNEHLEFAELKSNTTVNDLSAVFDFIDRTKQGETGKVATTILSNKDVSEKEWYFSAGMANKILEKLQTQPRRLLDVCDKMFQGIATSADKIYFLEHIAEKNGVVTGYSKSLDKEIQIEREFVKPMLKGADVHRYMKLMPKIWCLFPYRFENKKALLYSEKEIKKCFPMAWKYLLENKKALRDREHGRFKNEWWCFSRPQNLTEYDKKKIITPEISYGCNMTYDFDGLYHNTKCYSFIFKNQAKEAPLFYLALLNSRILWFFLTVTGYVLRGGYFVFKTNYLMPFPIPPELSEAEQQPFISIVERILAITKGDDYLPARRSLGVGGENPAKQAKVREYEKQIDQLVYKLYGLTKEEIKIVEKQT